MSALGPNILTTHQIPVIIMSSGSSDSYVAITHSKTAKWKHSKVEVDEGRKRVVGGPSEEDGESP